MVMPTKKQLSENEKKMIFKYKDEKLPMAQTIRLTVLRTGKKEGEEYLEEFINLLLLLLLSLLLLLLVLHCCCCFPLLLLILPYGLCSLASFFLFFLFLFFFYLLILPWIKRMGKFCKKFL
ncbi:hypothetical protein EHP00_2630 [Ecytonucleospora hepatopenaei]|uniref:Uncharacterized protein n=1 Tax=Ecytonucleospora hepatopenaei TaxID=646526 RepID=A0A1W0E8M6_9MICR|nr:hypothetical protein EHP00_2630 [Ecytonucleospora hepatopenaei]